VQTPTSLDPTYPPGTDGGSTKTRASEFGQRVVDAIDERKDAMATGMESAASLVRDKAESLPGGDRIVRAAETAADAMESAADYVREQDLRDMATDVGQLVKRHPGATLLVAAALGFVLARAISRH
jgi:ElaB/YqjD/DUF883 family membrane-anchored ribosome-binding protein